MEDYRVRMMEEHAELAKKVSKLQAFIESNPLFPGLELLQRSRLRRQLEAMSLYLYILSERINLDRPKPLGTATSSAVLGEPARTAQKQDEQTSKWIAVWAKERENGLDTSNAGWDEEQVCDFVAWLVDSRRMLPYHTGRETQ